jgi:hypothetical protein
MKIGSLKNGLLASAMTFVGILAIGQNNSANIYNTFDKTIQVKNAPFNNGKIHFNPFRSIDKTTRYRTDDFVAGAIVFDGQQYDNLALKYDLLKDELIVKFDGQGNKMGFSPVKQRIDAFYIDGLKFKNLDLVSHPDFVSGFYEETDAGHVILYTKHYKDQFTALTNEQVFYTYVLRNAFVFCHQSTFYKIDNENDAVKAFPQLEAPIAAFFRNNAPLEKTDRTQFMKKLARHLGELLNTAAK